MVENNIEVGHGVSLELAPMEVHTVAPNIPGEMLMMQPPRIDNWTVAHGAHKQKVEIGGSLLLISYLLGAARGKEGCGDSGLIMATAVPGALALVSETDDYLSQPMNDPNWHDVLNTSNRNFLVNEFPGDEEKIRWTSADVAGADLQRRFPGHDHAKYLKRRWINNLTSVIADFQPMRWGPYEYVPVQEKTANLMLIDWLEARNDYRWDRLRRLIDEVNRYYEIWRNYWLNAAIATLGMVINTQPKEKYASQYAGVAEVVSNADVSQLWSSSGLYYGIDPVFSSLDQPGVPGVGDINSKFDWLAKQSKLATEKGLVGGSEYHEKTAPDGVYMTWGPKEYRNRGWLTWAIARAFHDTQTERMGVGRKTIFAQATDGSINDSRNPKRDTVEANMIFANRARLLIEKGPGALAREIINSSEKPNDDYYMVVVEVFTN